MITVHDHVVREAQKTARSMYQVHARAARVLDTSLRQPEAIYTDLEGYACSAAYHFLAPLFSECADDWDQMIETYATMFMAAYQEAS